MLSRIDKLFSSSSILSRNDFKNAVKKGRVTLNGKVLKDFSLKVDEGKDEIRLDGKKCEFNKYSYIMLNKPLGVISASKSTDGDKTVIDILPDNLKRQGLFPCGRLDKNTVGLVIITNDGEATHRRLAPKNKTKKVYEFKTADEYFEEDIRAIEAGIQLKDGYLTKPCTIQRTDSFSGKITLVEGKYHEIRRLFGARGNKIVYLKRISFGGISLDENLDEGCARCLTSEEIALFIK